MRTLVVWNVPRYADAEDLKRLFGAFGGLAEVRFSRGRRYALVTFYDRASAQRALSSDLRMNEHLLKVKVAKWTIM